MMMNDDARIMIIINVNDDINTMIMINYDTEKMMMVNDGTYDDDENIK